LLLAVMGGFLALLGNILWGSGGMIILVAIGLLGILFNPGVSPLLVMRLYGAIPIGPRQLPGLWQTAQHLAERAALPDTPQLYYLPTRMLNAFAVGDRQQAAIAISDGLLRQLEPRELAGVLAHEISHIRSNDLWVMGLADLISRATSLLSLLGQFMLLVSLPLLLVTDVGINWLAILLLILAPTLSALAQLALSRTREYVADLNAVKLTGDPEGLARALAKIERSHGRLWERVIMPGRQVPEPSLLRTHPDTSERIQRLRSLQSDFPQRPVLPLESWNTYHGFGQPVTRPPRWHITGLWH